MLIVDNKCIETPIKDLLELLRQQLYISHIDKLDKIEKTGNNARVTCPIHNGGHERTPSCYILLEDKDDVPAGTVKCFGCGYKCNFIKFVADCLNINYRKAAEWVLNVSKYSLLDNKRDVDDLTILDNKIITQKHYISLDELKQYDYIHPYMFKRKLTDEIINKFEVGYDKKLDAITFPVYVDGNCEFVLKRSTNTKRFYMPPNIVKPVYGVDYLTGNDVYITESVINCLTLWSWGYESVALFGTGDKHQIDILKNLPQRNFILCLDPDEAGIKGTKKLLKELNNKLVIVKQIPKDKDVNDLTKEEFDELEESL